MNETVPLRCVVDTNVAATANGANLEAGGPACAAECARALQAVMSSSHVYIDDQYRILREYLKVLTSTGQAGPGTAFAKWVHDQETGSCVTRVPITPRAGTEDDFEELPLPRAGTSYDPSDRKFLAVAAAHGDHPPILQALDSKWWKWRESLKEAQVAVHFLCPKEIEEIHRRKK